MYTLRKITENQTYNESLGGGYSVVSKVFNYVEFCDNFKTIFGESVEESEKNANIHGSLVCFVVSNTLTPVYKDELVYIMTESGKTFECVNNPSKQTD